MHPQTHLRTLSENPTACLKDLEHADSRNSVHHLQEKLPFLNDVALCLTKGRSHTTRLCARTVQAATERWPVQALNEKSGV